MAKQTIGEFLATLRKANGYTQQEVADKLGISNRTLSGWECDNVLPDILLLPVLAELYGVTVDELLSGERKPQEEMVVSNKSERNIYKNRLSRFNMQVWILVGVNLLGGILALSGIFGLGFIPLIIGMVVLFACAFALLALWRNAETSTDEASEHYGAFCILLRKKVAACCYEASALTFLVSVVALFYVLMGYSINTINIPLVHGVIFISIGVLISIVFFVLGWVLYKKALTKWGDDTARSSIGKSRRYFWTVGFWGTFPFVCALIVAIVLGSVDFEKKEIIYENESVDEFVRHMESIEHNGNVYYFSLSELALGAQNGDKFDLGDGFSATYRDGQFLFGEMGQMDGVPMIIMHTVKSTFIHGEYDTFRVYILRYYDPGPGVYNSNTPYYKRRENYYVKRVGYGLAYMHYSVSDYSQIGYTVAVPTIVLDLIVCSVLCIYKRNEYAVKL